MQTSSEQPLVGEERYVTTRITAAKETRFHPANYLIWESTNQIHPNREMLVFREKGKPGVPVGKKQARRAT